VVIFTGMVASSEITSKSSPAMGLRDAHCAKLTRRMSFLELLKPLRISEALRPKGRSRSTELTALSMSNGLSGKVVS